MAVTLPHLLLSCLYVLRVILCLLPQHGYIQPDEFFQFTEPSADRSLGCQTYLPWELTRSHPIRSMFFPVLIAQSAFHCIRWLSLQPSGYVLLLVPRFLITLLSFVCDWGLTVILRHLNRDQRQTFWCRFSLASSYISFTYMTHTFSNSIETMLFCILLVSVIKSLGTEGKSSADATGVILALGFFNRPTFAAFAAVPLMWLATNGSFYSMDKSRSLRIAFQASRSFAICSAVMIAWDTSYYTDILVDFWNIPGTDYWDKLVICPLNFVAYNMRTENLARHGLHPRYLHLFNLFLVLTVLTVPFYCVACRFFGSVRRGSLTEQANNWLICSSVVPITALMIFPHQEPRFLIPVLVTACALVGDRLSQKRYLIPWLISNTFLLVVYGFIHQAGVTRSLLALNHMIRTNEVDPQHSSIIFSNMYLPPQHLMNAPKNLPVYDLSVDDYPESLMDQLELESHMNRTVYLIAPSCLEEGIRTMVLQYSSRELQLLEQFFPHFSGELLMHSWNILMTSGDLTQALSLNMWKLASS